MSAKPLFTDFGLDDDLTAALGERGIVHPFPIQEITLPLALKGHDIIGQARTGTGKTLGFGLPLLQRIDTSKAQTQAMVIVPTRELCIQVADDLTIGSHRGITTIAVYGGVGYDEQIEALTGGVHVVIGTPGRTIDHLNRGNLDVSQIRTVVLDEADEMLDMGFLPDVERLLADVPDERQTMLFSATMPTEIVKLARRFMAKPTFMRADETLHETAPTVDQHFFLVHRMDKPRVLARLLQKPDRGGAFVFCRTKRMCDRLVQELADLGVTAIAVHGDLRQSSRQKNLDRFRDGKADVLVATEVAARGLDVSNVSHVINYDCPDDEKMYLHRIGRTARAGESGMAVTFAEFNEVDRVNVIRKRVAVEEEMTEIFSTSDELTKMFDLPDETPWDALTSSKSSRPSTRSGPGSSESKSKSKSKDSRSKARKSSSGSNRSSARGAEGRRTSTSRSGGRSNRDSSKKTQPDAATTSTRASSAAQDGNNDSADKGRTTRRASSSSSRTRSRSRSRTSTEAVIAHAKESRDSSPSNASDRSGTPGDTDGGTSSGVRRRSSRSSDDANVRTSREKSDSADRGGKPSRGDSTEKKTDSSGTTGGGRKRARPRARRNREEQSSSSNGSSTGNSGRSDNDGGEKSSATRTSGGASRGSSSGGSTSRSSNSRSTSTRRDDTTRRGDDARGDGTPRPRRRVDVEHLP